MYDNYQEAMDEADSRRAAEVRDRRVASPANHCVFGYGGKLVVADEETFVTERVFGQQVHEGRVIPVFYSSKAGTGREDLARAWLRQERYKDDIRERPEELVGALSKFVNCFNDKEHLEKVAELVMREHRTLQQSIFRLFLRCIRRWAETPESRYDLRNEATVKACRKIATLTEDTGLPLI